MASGAPYIVHIPYGRGSLKLDLWRVPGARVIEGEIATAQPSDTGEALVHRALEEPIGTPHLAELARTAHSVAIVTSDHTRAMPSGVTMPLLLEEVRAGKTTDARQALRNLRAKHGL